MKILIAHNRYRERGGEDVVFEQESALLEERGEEVIRYERCNEEAPKLTLIGKLGAAASALWSRATYSDFSSLLRAENPEIVHVHNFFLAISPSIFQACHDAQIPVVHTLHNYRLLCPGTNFYRNGGACERCARGNAWHGIAHGCYRSSRIATGIAASMVAYNSLRGTWTRAIDRYIAPTHFLKSKLMSAGWSAERITVKPHFVNSDPGISRGPKTYAIYIGRLSPEKGLVAALAAWEQLKDIPLWIVGDGPQRGELQAIVRERNLNIRFAGRLPRAQVLELLRDARLLIFPSTAYESFGLGIIEAFACGVPVIASNHGAMQELVEPGRTGLLFPPGDSAALRESVRSLWSDTELRNTMSVSARGEFKNKYTPDVNYHALMSIYRQALAARALPDAAALPVAA
ncbi:MAG TPA: glycosyltransferase family 4 protein [Terriglobales bacterium]|nr:glycosyltransferase family 4 protein [Terriglobales bacterium]